MDELEKTKEKIFNLTSNFMKESTNLNILIVEEFKNLFNLIQSNRDCINLLEQQIKEIKKVLEEKLN